MAPISLSTPQEISTSTPVNEEEFPNSFMYAWCTVAQKPELVNEEEFPNSFMYAWCTIA